MTLSIAVLFLLGQVNFTVAAPNKESNEKIVGLGQHILKEGKVTLAEGSRIAITKDIEQYKERFADACDVTFDRDGNK